MNVFDPIILRKKVAQEILAKTGRYFMIWHKMISFLYFFFYSIHILATSFSVESEVSSVNYMVYNMQIHVLYGELFFIFSEI